MEAKVVQEGKERVLIIAVDFDGCLGHSIYTENYKRMEEELPKDCTPEQREAALKVVIQESNAALIQDIVNRCQEYDRVVVIVGSNRQSANKDQHDGQKNKNGSCFEATAALEKVLKERVNKPVKLEKYLTFDSILELPAGSNFALQQQETTEIFNKYTQSIDLKYRLAYFQMQKVCADYPNASVSYIHYDDRDEIAGATAKEFKSETGQHFPPNMVKATACQYDLYNPYAEVQTLARIAKQQSVENPTQIVDEHTLAQMNTALETIFQESESFENIFAKHQDAIKKVEERRAALIEQRKTPTLSKEESIKITKEIISLESSLAVLEKPQNLKKIIERIRETYGSNLPDRPLTWLQFYDLAKEADLLTNNNVQTKNLGAFPEIQKECAVSSTGMDREHIAEIGHFERTIDEGHQIEMGTFDRIVRECMSDDIIERTNTYELLVKEEAIIKQVIGIENAINDGSFKPEMIDRLDQIALDRIIDPLKNGLMSGKISFDMFKACLDKLYSKPEDKMIVLQGLFDQVTDSNNTLYSPPKNPVVGFLKGLAGKEKYSSERLGHIAQLQNEYLKIARDNKDNQKVKNHVASSTLPDWETRHLFIGINHATQCRKQLMALYDDDPNMTIQQLFTLSTESGNPFKADGVGGFIATTLLGAKRRLASFSTEQIARYIADHPEQAPHLLAAYKDDLARNPDTILMILGNTNTHEAVVESKLLESKYLSPEQIKYMYPILDRKQSPPSISPSPPKNEGEPPIPTTPVAEDIRKDRPALPTIPVSEVISKGRPPQPTTPVAEVIRKGRPPLPTTPISEVIRKGRPAPPSHAAPPPPSTAPVIPPERRPAMPTMSPTPIPEGKRPPPSHAAPSIPPSTPTVTLSGESPLRPKKPLPAIPNVENKAPAHDGPSDEEVERAMKVLDSLESSPRPGWTQESSSDTESKDRDQSGENLSDKFPSSDEGEKGPE